MRRHYLSLVVVCAAWGTIPLLVRSVDLAPAGIAFVRVWVGALALGALHLARVAAGAEAGPGADVPGLFRVRPLRCLAVGALLAAHWTAMFAGYQHAPADTVIFLVFLAPIGIALTAPRVLGERLALRTVVALAVAVAGFALVAGPRVGGDAEPIGIAWAAASGLMLVVLVLVSKPLAETYGGARLTLIELLGAGLALIPVGLTVDWRHVDAGGWLALVVLGLAHTALGISVYLAALAVVPATHTGILGYLEPVAVVVLAWAVLGDAPTLSTALGGALIVAAGSFVVFTAEPLPSLPEVPARVPG